MKFGLLGLFSARRVIRAVESIAESQRRQTALLVRLAERFTPDVEIVLAEKDVKAVTEITYSRDAEQVAIQAYTQRVYEQTGHIPSEEEIIAFLDERFGTGGLRIQ